MTAEAPDPAPPVAPDDVPINPAPTPMAEWLGVDEATMRTIDVKIGLMGAIRENRRAAGLTQAALAKRLGVARPRVAEWEGYRPESSLDALIPAFFGSGGTVDQLCAIVRRTDRSIIY